MTTTDTDTLEERIRRARSVPAEWARLREGESTREQIERHHRRMDEQTAALVAEEVRKAKAEAWDEGALKAWSVSTVDVNGQRYHWRKSGEPKNPYRETGDSNER